MCTGTVRGTTRLHPTSLRLKCLTGGTWLVGSGSVRGEGAAVCVVEWERERED